MNLPTQLLERETSLAMLAAALREASAGEGRLALVSGEAGLGKTSLVERFTQEHSGSARVLWGACDSLFTPRPLGPLHDMAAQMQGDFPALLHADASRTSLFAAFLSHLQDRPAVAVFEDVHWADEATLDLVKFLGRRITRTCALLVLTYRDDELGPKHPLRIVLGDLAASPAVRRIALAPLSVTAVRALAGKSAIDSAALHLKTGGNPFFVTEVLASAGDRLPATVRDAVLARAARLSPSGQAVLQAAAVIGPRIELGLLSEITGAEFTASEESLSIGMLVPHSDTLAFRHELARQTVLESIPPAHRMVLNRLALEALKAAPAARSDLPRLAHHAEAAGDMEAVLQYAPAAARQAAAAGAHREAAALYALALRYADSLSPDARAEVLDAYAEECNLIDQRTQGLAARQNALALWRECGQPLKAGETLAHMAVLHNGLGNTHAAAQACDQAIALLEAQPSGPELAFAYRIRSGILMLLHKHAEAIEWGEKAIALAQRFGEPDLVLETQVPLASAWMEIDFDRGHDLFLRVIAAARQAGLVKVAAHAYANLSSEACELYRFDVAEAAAQEGLAYAAEHGQERFRLYMLAWQSVTQMRLGRWDEAADTAGLVLGRPGVSATSRITALAALGMVRARRGDPGSGALLDEALDLLRDMASLHRVALVRAARAEAAWLAGNLERVRAEALAAFDLAVTTRHAWFGGELAFWLVRAGEETATAEWMAEPCALHLTGDWRGAASAWEALGCPYEQARALSDGDRESQRKALEIFDRLGARPAADQLREAMRAAGQTGIPRGPRPATRENPYGLTPRQVEILRCLVDGLTNADIAARMHISPKTVDHHVSAVLSRMSVHTREAAADLARAHPQLNDSK